MFLFSGFFFFKNNISVLNTVTLASSLANIRFVVCLFSEIQKSSSISYTLGETVTTHVLSLWNLSYRNVKKRNPPIFFNFQELHFRPLQLHINLSKKIWVHTHIYVFSVIPYGPSEHLWAENCRASSFSLKTNRTQIKEASATWGAGGKKTHNESHPLEDAHV